MAIHLLGIRHHGPGSARSVLAALDELQPSIVLVESPAETEAMFRWVGEDGLEPPVAMLGYVVDEPRRAVFAPLASFSPEWQAIHWANAHGVPAVAIDLPLANVLAPGRTDDGMVAEGEPPDPIGALAAAAGEPDAERWWDDVIEHRGEGLPAFEAVAEAMTVVRAGTRPSPSEAQREAHMRSAIRSALRDGHGPIVVVCGAWHVPALDVAANTAAADRDVLRGLPKAKVDVSWVPWTNARLAYATGYGAGVRSPGWYDHVFRHPGPDGIARFFVDAARVLRDADLQASPDHLIAATRVADALAVMRGRPRPGLAEVLDAADTVMGGLPLVERKLVVGSAIGSVPDDAPQVPLARDLARRQRAARLKPEAEAHVIELDLRTPNGLRRSICCTNSLHSACRGARWRRGAAPAGRSAKRGGSGGDRNGPFASWRSPGRAPRSSKRPPTVSSNVPVRRRACSTSPARSTWHYWPRSAMRYRRSSPCCRPELPTILTSPTSWRRWRRSRRHSATATCGPPTWPPWPRCSTGSWCACWPDSSLPARRSTTRRQR